MQFQGFLRYLHCDKLVGPESVSGKVQVHETLKSITLV